MSRWAGTDELFFLANQRVGDWGRRLMHLVPAPAVRLMKRRVQSWPGARQENRCSLCLVFRIGHIVFHGWRTNSFSSEYFLSFGSSCRAALKWNDNAKGKEFLLRGKRICWLARTCDFPGLRDFIWAWHMSFLSFVKNKMLVVPLEESLVRSGTTSIFYKRNGHVGK